CLESFSIDLSSYGTFVKLTTTGTPDRFWFGSIGAPGPNPGGGGKNCPIPNGPNPGGGGGPNGGPPIGTPCEFFISLNCPGVAAANCGGATLAAACFISVDGMFFTSALAPSPPPPAAGASALKTSLLISIT